MLLSTLTTEASEPWYSSRTLTMWCLSGSYSSRLMPGRSTTSQSWKVLLAALDQHTPGAAVQVCLRASPGRRPAGAVDDQLHPQAFPIGQELAGIDIFDGMFADVDLASAGLHFLMPAGVIRVHLEQGCQGGASLISEIDTGTKSWFFRATFSADLPMRPKP